MARQMITIFGEVDATRVEELSELQRQYLSHFFRVDEHYALAAANGYHLQPGPLESDYAVLEMQVEADDVLRHNPREGCVVYGAAAADLERIKAVFGTLKGLGWRPKSRPFRRHRFPQIIDAWR